MNRVFPEYNKWMLCVRQYEPKDQLLLAGWCLRLCSGHSHEVLDDGISSCIGCGLPRQIDVFGTKRVEVFIRNKTPARYNGGNITTNYNAATGERWHHITSPPWRVVFADSLKLRHEQNNQENSENGSKVWHFTTHSHTSNLQGGNQLHVGIAN